MLEPYKEILYSPISLYFLHFLLSPPLPPLINIHLFPTGREDFPSKWEGLIQEMVEHFKGGDFHKINGILRTAHSLTKRYRHEFKSQELWVEIKLVLDLFADPFSELFVSTMALISQHAQNKQALHVRARVSRQARDQSPPCLLVQKLSLVLDVHACLVDLKKKEKNS